MDYTKEVAEIKNHEGKATIVFKTQVCKIPDGARLYLLAHPQEGCTRSHPHEDMSPFCELKTEIARLQDQLTVITAQRDLLAEAARITRKYLYSTREQLVECDLILGFALLAMKK